MGPVLLHKARKLPVHRANVLLLLVQVLLRGHLEGRDRALPLARCGLDEVQPLPLQPLRRVGDLSDDPDGAHRCKGRAQDLVRAAGHEVAATRRELVHADGEPHGRVPLAQAQQLGSRQAVAGHGATGAVQEEHDLLWLRARRREDRGDLAREVLGSGSAQVPFKLQDIDSPRRHNACGRRRVPRAHRLALGLRQPEQIVLLAEAAPEVLELVLGQHFAELLQELLLLLVQPLLLVQSLVPPHKGAHGLDKLVLAEEALAPPLLHLLQLLPDALHLLPELPHGRVGL
mmetsp:Transcript_113920/g.332881  ORF Transcript_113920/g.332881 Transcript_113920/m.332881 type:complete len:287 (+) Transcript_113920:493-1353(+)